MSALGQGRHRESPAAAAGAAFSGTVESGGRRLYFLIHPSRNVPVRPGPHAGH
ncbi:hypothetical protein LA76x_1988 [Lysobacter antibioticus]|uniref:Uncharacterized protein n=1 Tax=Lysobacter antibioticus TaxID=84531 RepID=A0A0S2F9G7_LYSAN|nr:hypothetical protein LA76x_1988 [Lysobacter antibioticus]